MPAIANGCKVRAGHSQFRNARTFANVATLAAMLEVNFATGFHEARLRERRAGQMCELSIADRLVREWFVGAFTPEKPQLRIAFAGAAVDDLDGVGAFVQPYGFCFGLCHATNALEIKQHSIIHLQLHTAFARNEEGIIASQINIHKSLESSGEASRRHKG